MRRIRLATALLAASLLVSASACSSNDHTSKDKLDAATEDTSQSDAAADTGDSAFDATADATDATDAAQAWAPTGPLDFPDGFLFGTAIAGFQSDMGCPTLAASQCDDPNSDWYQLVTSDVIKSDASTHVPADIDPPDHGPGFWELYDDDLTRASDELHNNAFRMSIEWSRIFPTATDGVEGYDNLKAIANQDAIDHYHQIFASLKQHGLRPLVTLNHYTLPTWIHDAVGCHQDLDTCTKKGWVDDQRTIREIAKYAGFCAHEFGGEVDLWATENEPLAVVLPGYLEPTGQRSNPPAVSLNQNAARTVFNALIEAHAQMYDAVKANDTVDADGDGKNSRVGLVYAMAPVRPKDPSSPKDVKAAKNVFYLWNLAFLDAIAKGIHDTNLDGHGQPEAALENRLDFLGINYYVRITVAGANGAMMPNFTPLSTFNPLLLQSDETYPRGIYDVVNFAHNRYQLPIIITENGVAWHPDNPDPDAAKGFYVRHLAWLWRAIDQGADVQGYFVWTLTDNYEWNHGMSMKMGLYGVDPLDPDKKRTKRPTADVYADIAANGAVSQDLLQQYPVSTGPFIKDVFDGPAGP